MRPLFLSALLASLAIACPQGAQAGDCTGNVVGVRPIDQYDHALGRGFLALRAGASSGYQQIGELYAGDEVSVWARDGRWLLVQCMSGQCQAPMWGQPSPRGWAYDAYLRVAGVCP